MGWQDRLREAAYTSPSGERLTFDFENVKRSTKKRTTTFDFPGVDEAYVQDNGHGARRFPLRCYFSGDDHDLAALAFESALLERGLGRLEHPLYGTADVVPTGSITRRDDLRSAANQTIIEVTFSSSLAAVYPQIQTDRGAEVGAAVVLLDQVGAAQFLDSTDLSTVVAQETTKTTTKTAVTTVSASLGAVAKVTAAANAAFSDALDAIDLGLDVLIADPEELAQQLFALITGPARAAATIEARLDGYAELAAAIIAAPAAKPWESFVGGIILAGRRRVVANDFHLSVLLGSAAVAGTIVSATEAQFASRPAAISAAETVLDELDALVAWMDTGFESLAGVDAPGGIDTGATYQAVQNAAALTAGHLVDISFSLVPERVLVLDRPRTIIDLSAELYGSVDNERLDFLITTNDFSGSELLEVPRGRSVVYYA